MIHAMRALDLFTQKEWSTLSSVARSKKKAGNQSYLDWAIKEYENDKLSDVSLMEEAIAEMVRDSLANPKLVQGKPRALLKRITNFLVSSATPSMDQGSPRLKRSSQTLAVEPLAVENVGLQGL